MKKIKEKIEGKQELSLDEERKLIESKNLALLKKYFQYAIVRTENEVQLVYNLSNTNLIRTYIKSYGFSSEHAMAACAKLCNPKVVKLMIKEEYVFCDEVEKELIKRGDKGLIEAYEAKWGAIAVDPQ